MEQPLRMARPDILSDTGPDDELPPGDHALEVAARKGFGPLSPVAKRVWHGDASPCVTCGQLVHLDNDRCDHCGQDLREEMIEKMRTHAGPWYVLEHLRPFPGVSLDRIVRQIRRGIITETSIVRGPSTDYQWRFAVETPGLCRYFAKCWHCHHVVSPSDTYCQSCLSHLTFEKPRPVSAIVATITEPRAERSPSATVARATMPQPVSERGTEATRPADPPHHSEPRELSRAVGVPTYSEPWSQRSPTKPGGRAAPPVLEPGSELAKLANVVQRLEAIPAVNSGSPRLGPVAATLIAVTLVVAVIGVVLVAGRRNQVARPSTPATTSLVAPVSP